VPVTFDHCFLFIYIFYSLFFTALDALPCPALPLPYPALPCPISNFPFVARDSRRKLHRERAVFFFLLLPGTGGGSYTLPCKTDRQTNRQTNM